MSNRRKLRPTSLPAVATLDLLVGHQVMGGCQDCDSYTRVHRDAYGYVVRTHHADSCPTWAAIRRARRNDERNT